MKILLTGSSGFIGFHLTKKLLSLGHEVIGIDNHNDYYDPKLKETRLKNLPKKNFKFYNQDINEINIREKAFDIAINLAAQAGVRVKPEMEYLYEHSNIEGYKSFCNFCFENNVTKVIYASSSSVYSDKGGSKFTEEVTHLEPKSMYGKSKLFNETYSTHLASITKIQFVGLRFFSVYGPYGRPDMAYYLFTEALKKNKKIMLNNDGNMLRDMTYIDDIVDGIINSINLLTSGLNNKSHEIINLGNDNPITTLMLLNSLEKKLNKNSKIINIKTSNESAYTHADITKAGTLIGYKPKIGLEEGINRFLEWHNYYENV